MYLGGERSRMTSKKRSRSLPEAPSPQTQSHHPERREESRHPERSLARSSRQTQSKDPEEPNGASAVRTFLSTDSAKNTDATKPTHDRLGHKFKDGSLLERALTHRSLAYETDPQSLANPDADNEQLEFVGDAVLGLVVAEALYRRFPQSHEGELTQLRASLVSRKHLSTVAVRLDLGSMLRLGKGEERSGGRSKAALLSNALEAVIAAIYLDGGLKAAQTFIERTIIEPALPELDLACAGNFGQAAGDSSSGVFSGAVGDHKSALQEHLQAIGAGQPEYVLVSESGPDHSKRFRVAVRTTTDGTSTVLAESEGATKKAAQQEAARIAFGKIVRAARPLPGGEAGHP
jgi:ribonuclease-3